MPRRATTGEGDSAPSTMLRSQQVEATRRAVLAAARSSFGRKGYAQTSVDEIAAAARVTKGAVYHHFAGKKALFRAVHAEVEAEALARTAAAADPRGSPIDQIVAQVGAYLDVALDEEIQQITDRYRCVTLDLPLGAHPRPLSAEADRSATSLARLLLDCCSTAPTSRMPRWSPTTRPADYSCSRSPLIIRRSVG